MTYERCGLVHGPEPALKPTLPPADFSGTMQELAAKDHGRAGALERKRRAEALKRHRDDPHRVECYGQRDERKAPGPACNHQIAIHRAF